MTRPIFHVSQARTCQMTDNGSMGARIRETAHGRPYLLWDLKGNRLLWSKLVLLSSSWWMIPNQGQCQVCNRSVIVNSVRKKGAASAQARCAGDLQSRREIGDVYRGPWLEVCRQVQFPPNKYAATLVVKARRRHSDICFHCCCRHAPGVYDR
ncbi:hypothetical protein LZ32DRAFT_597763 [Colletotrichum eremochloae]|nr:hypothetical protein LZ32DRAFT_597763 [Colletotrichum eremochloae]